jgi:hypothetical protein
MMAAVRADSAQAWCRRFLAALEEGTPERTGEAA